MRNNDNTDLDLPDDLHKMQCKMHFMAELFCCASETLEFEGLNENFWEGLNYWADDFADELKICELKATNLMRNSR